MEQNKRTTGSQYEQLAARYLTDKGMQIIAMNYRCRSGEIDIIAMDGRTLVFVEVKYRSSTAYGYPEEAVDNRKQAKIHMVARYFLMDKRYNEETPIRFDVIAILGNQIKHIRNAF